jgi:hypothetical protein
MDKKFVIVDKPGAGNAHHIYRIMEDYGETELTTVRFQNGPVLENGINGCHIEDLLNIVAHRLACFQTSQYACNENLAALTDVRSALSHLASRTQKRVARGIEGTLAVGSESRTRGTPVRTDVDGDC